VSKNTLLSVAKEVTFRLMARFYDSARRITGQEGGIDLM
jgi:hypothetical protein